MPNVENLRLVANDIRTHEDQFNLSRWRTFRDTGENSEPDNPYLSCNTICCICGWVNARIDNQPICGQIDYSDSSTAAEWLGLSEDFADRLFIPIDLPEVYDKESINYKTAWSQAARLGIIPDNRDVYGCSAEQAAQVLEAIADGRIKTY